MSTIAHVLASKSKKTISSIPEFFNLAQSTDREKLLRLLRDNRHIGVVDDFEEQLRELFAISHPSLVYGGVFEQKFQAHKNRLLRRTSLDELGVWVYFPWLGHVSHILHEQDFFKVRTARNKLLITEQEQKQFYDAIIGIAGLSIGSSVAMAIVVQGGARRIRLADFDRLALSNTNRVRAGVQSLGLPKVEIAARQIYEINPFTRIEIFSEGLRQSNIKKFVSGLDVLVDEMDDIATKILLRHEAKKQKIATVMGADNGDMAVIDVERYDNDPHLKFFHGRLGSLTPEDALGMSKFEIGRTIAQLVGLENHTPRMLASLQEMGKTIVSWPQLGGTAQLNGAAIAYCVRRIVTGQPVVSGRGIMSFDSTLDAGYETKKARQARHGAIQKFKNIFKL